ncbi:chymotrypsinogen B-like [Gigantopelta aegis]|uniref:chymotrypsinogen B-like n=1 Tax=Gigantopelta aegis TaxID=1735272 RepID=UPI001B88E723|nr:chymotrypsinogen B-like [Gigantopelta aegis]
MKCQQNMHWSNKRRTCVVAGSRDDDCKVKSFLKKTYWKINNKPARKTCGAKISPNIVGGFQTRPGEWPWMVSLQLKDRYSPQYIHFCGGVVIDEKWILTASHCVVSKQRVKGMISVVFGAHQLSKPHKTQHRRGVEHIFLHPKYRDRGSFPNDIALLKLADPVDFNDGIIRDICLPEPGEDIRDEGYRSSELGCWLAGWGVTQRSGNGDILQELKTNLVNFTFCRKQWGDFVTKNHICVGMGDKGACRGDSGGPLMCSKGGRFYIAGIVSWGEETCMEYGYPNIFTKVQIYSRWIQDTMKSNP